MDDSQVIRRTHQEGESSQVGAKIPLRTSDADDFDYLPDVVREENKRAFEEMERRKIQDKKDLKAAYRLAAQEANFKYPLSSQTDALKNIENGKNEDYIW